MSSHKNRVKMTSATTGTGTLTLGSASSGYQSFATAYGADATVDILITEGTAWEVARDCAYTNSGTTVSRGTLEASSTGSAINFGGTQEVSVIATADRGRSWDSAALNTKATGTDANTTMAVNTMYVVDMSAWATADRTYTLPATAAVGDRVGVMVTAGDATHELILTAGTGDTLNGVAGGTEWSRLFITNEVVIMRCIVANTTWVVEQDGRKFEACRIDTAGSTTSCASTTSTKISNDLATVTSDPSVIWSTASKQLLPRRKGRFLIHGHTQMASVNAGNAFVAQIYKNGSVIGGGPTATSASGATYPESDVVMVYDVTTVGDYFELWQFNGDVTKSTNTANVYFEATRIGDVI